MFRHINGYYSYCNSFILTQVYSSKNNSICEEEQVNLIVSQYGVITSPHYPKWTTNARCGILLTAPESSTIRVYISDLNTEAANDEGRCERGSLTLRSGTSFIHYCGDKTPSGEYVFLSCDNTLVINYTSSSIASTTNRGFNLYYEGKIDNLKKVLKYI